MPAREAGSCQEPSRPWEEELGFCPVSAGESMKRFPSRRDRDKICFLKIDLAAVWQWEREFWFSAVLETAVLALLPSIKSFSEQGTCSSECRWCCLTHHSLTFSTIMLVSLLHFCIPFGRRKKISHKFKVEYYLETKGNSCPANNFGTFMLQHWNLLMCLHFFQTYVSITTF